MRWPYENSKKAAALLEEGLIDQVIGQLMSGKEATVYVCARRLTRCAKVYKDAKQRSFRQAASYREGRTVKNSRKRARWEKGHALRPPDAGRSWQNAESTRCSASPMPACVCRNRTSAQMACC